jgi:hypothetical protein
MAQPLVLDWPDSDVLEDPAEPDGSDVPPDSAGSVADPLALPESAVSVVPPDPGEGDDAEPSVGRVGDPDEPGAAVVVAASEVPDEPDELDPAPSVSLLVVVLGPLPVSVDADLSSPGSGVFGGSSLTPGSSVPGLVALIALGLSSAGVSPP